MIDNVKCANDLSFGMRKELEVHNILKEHFNKDVKKFKEFYSVYDYYILNNEKKITDIIEVKSRRNDSKKYDTQLIGKNKVDKGMKELEKGKNVFFIFNLTDGVFKFELKKEHKFKEVICGNYARGDKSSKLVLIPNEYLTKIMIDEKGTINF